MSMETCFRNVWLVFAIAVLSFVSPAVAAGGGTSIGVSVQGAIGSHIGDGGDTESLSLGVWFGEHVRCRGQRGAAAMCRPT